MPCSLQLGFNAPTKYGPWIQSCVMTNIEPWNPLCPSTNKMYNEQLTLSGIMVTKGSSFSCTCQRQPEIYTDPL